MSDDMKHFMEFAARQQKAVRRLLWVNDNPDVLVFFKDFLTDKNEFQPPLHKILETRDQETTREMIERHQLSSNHIDVVVIDRLIPVDTWNGVDEYGGQIIAEEVRKTLPRAYIIQTTSDPDHGQTSALKAILARKRAKLDGYHFKIGSVDEEGYEGLLEDIKEGFKVVARRREQGITAAEEHARRAQDPDAPGERQR